MISALLLDFDGTVANTHDLIFQAYSHTLKTHLGVEGRRELWAKTTGLPLVDVLAAAWADAGQELPPVEPVVHTYRQRMRELDDTVHPFPGILEVLETIKSRGVRLALVTTKHQAMLSRHLPASGLDHLFEVVVTGDQCRHCKPHPEPFLKALDELGIPPDGAIGIGDSQYDIQSSRAAGLQTAAALWGAENRPAVLAARPDWRLETVGDLLRLVEGEKQANWPGGSAGGR